MVRPRRKSFFLANERIKRINDLQNQSSQSTYDAETRQNTERNRRQTRRNSNTASQRSANSEVRSGQSSNNDGVQRRTRGGISQRRNTIADSQSTIVSEAPPSPPPPPPRIKRPAQRLQRLKGIENRESNGNDETVPSRAKVTKRRNTNVNTASQSTVAEEPELNNNQQNQRRTRAKSVHSRKETTDSQSIFNAPQSTPIPRGRPARRQNRLATTNERESSARAKENTRRTRSKSTHQRDPIVDEPELNNNQRETRSKSAQRRAVIAVQQAEAEAEAEFEPEPEPEPPVSPIPMVIDNEREEVSITKNNRKKLRPKKDTASKVQIRRNTIAVNDRELNDVVNFDPSIQAPQMREFSIQLQRLNSDTIKQHLAKNRGAAVTKMQSMACNSQAAKKIINRRCTVNLERVETPEEEDEEEEETDEEASRQPDQIPNDIQLQPSSAQPPRKSVLVLASSSHAKSIGRSMDSGLPTTVDPSEIEPNEIESNEIEPDSDATTYYNSDGVDHEMSSEISLQNKSLSQDLLTQAQAQAQAHAQAQVQVVQDGIDAMDIDEASGIISHRDRRARFSVDTNSDEDADEEDGFDENASTYCSEIRTQIDITQMLISQIDQYHTWNYNRSYSTKGSVDTMEVQFDGPDDAGPNNSSNSSSNATSNKCFIDSPLVSYGEFIKYGNQTFAVNCLTHNDKNIRHHFLSKYSSDHIHTLNQHFQGKLWVTKTTANLYLKHSDISPRQVIVLNYYQPTKVGNATVTAIEAPNFPGGALFLFEAAGENSIIHVGDLRLHAEVTENEFLMKTNIDEVRFDKSMLSRVFHCFPLCTDRCVALKAEIGRFIDTNQAAGLRNLIAVGAFEIGMEAFLYELGISFGAKIYMPEEQRNFLDELVKNSQNQNNPNDFCAQLRHLVTDDRKAQIHVLKVEEITNDNLMTYISRFNCHRVLGVRPRGCDNELGVVSNGAHKIVDVANPLIGDVSEYERFVVVVVEKSMTTPPLPADHNDGEMNGQTAHDQLELIRRRRQQN